MRFLSITLWAFLMLTQGAQAQNLNASPEKPMTDQMERGVTLSAPTQSSSPEDVTKVLQTELKRVGCYDSLVDGVWGGMTKTALLNFVRYSKADVPTEAASELAVNAIKSRTDRVCPLECGPGRLETNGQCVAKPQPSTPVQPQAKPVARPQAPAEARRPAARERSEDSPSSGMCWRQDGRGTSLVPCNEAPTGRRAY